MSRMTGRGSPRAVGKSVLVVSLTSAAVALASCTSLSESGPAQIGHWDGTSMVCMPAEHGQLFLTGDGLTYPDGMDLQVTDLSFADAAGVEIGATYAASLGEFGGINLYPLDSIDDGYPGLWESRTELPVSGDALAALSEVRDGNLRTVAVLAVVERVAEDDTGTLGAATISYTVGGFAYTTTSTLTYFLNDGKCEPGNDTGFGRRVEE